MEVEKKIKYTLKEGQRYVESMKTNWKKVDVIVLHTLGNDITDEIQEHCSEKLNKLCVDIQKNYKYLKVIVSMGMPRADEEINRKSPS